MCFRSLVVVKRHNGCNCPKGFSGDHCEVFGTSTEASTSGHNANNSESGGRGGKNVPAIVLSVLIVGAVASTIAFVYRWRWSKSGRDPNFVEKAVFPATTGGEPASNTTPAVDVGPEKDLDGNELENVEII